MNFNELKERTKTKYEEVKTEIIESKPVTWIRENKRIVGAIGLGVFGAVSMIAAENNAYKRGYSAGLSKNALNARDNKITSDILDYIENSGEDGATFRDTANNRRVTFKKVSEEREI